MNRRKLWHVESERPLYDFRRQLAFILVLATSRISFKSSSPDFVIVFKTTTIIT
jgi:hypothetical protein